MANLQQVHTTTKTTYKTHYLAVHSGTFPTKESFNMPVITNWFKRNGQSKRYSILEVLKMSAQAKCYIPSNIELDENGYSFISSSLMLFDVDDDNCVTEPKEVLHKLNDICAGLFFTSSHGIKGNRYRLVFQLDAPVRNKEAYKYIFEVISDTLKSYGVPVDEQARDPLQRVRTANKGYIEGNLKAVIYTAPILERMIAETEERLKAKAKKMKAYGTREHKVLTVEQLKLMAEKIGYVSDIPQWHRLGYSIWSYVKEGHIDEVEGFEIFTILCGGNDESERWQRLSKPNEMTIGTFIDYAKECGFKGGKYAHAYSKVELGHKVEHAKFDKYIKKSFARDLLEAEQRILVKSPTGSGKTHSFITASKELAAELAEENFNRFYLFTAPTIALAEQVAQDHDVMCVKGEVKDLYQKVKRYIKNGGRVFSVTYDLALSLSDMIESIQKHCTFAVMVDEVHRLTVDYSYRKTAIDNLMRLEQKTSVKSYVALTGTVDAVLREPFEREIHIQTKNDKPPCQMYGAITYNTKKEGEPLLYQVIKQKAENNKKLLVFVQNKELIKRLQQRLLKNGINAKAITSDGKSNNTAYYSLVKESKFPDGVQVILTTSLLADGVNILNENSNYECIVYTASDSMLFDIDTLRQCCNRFRNTYKAFYVFIQKEHRDVDFTYNLEAAYQHDTKIAKNILELLKEEFNGPTGYKLFSSAKIEETFGISVDALGDWHYNEMLIRHSVNEEKAKFYKLYRGKIIQALQRLMGFEASEAINASELREVVDLSEIEKEIDELKEAEKLEKAEKMERIGEIYTTTVHKALAGEPLQDVNEQQREALIKSFKQATATEHYLCIKELAPIADYTTVKKVVSTVKNRNKTSEFKRHLEALAAILHFEKVNRNTATKQVFNALKTALNSPMRKDDANRLINKVNQKSRKSKIDDVKFIAEYYFIRERKRSNGEYFITLKELTIKSLAAKYELTELDIINCLKESTKNGKSVIDKFIQNMAV